MKDKNKIDYNNERAEFACAVCTELSKRKYPNAIGCPWRHIDGEYCDELLRVMRKEAATEEKKKIAYICSPYRANTIEGVNRHKAYARQLVKMAIDEGYTPICPHLYITEVLNDNNPHEREQGLRVGLELLKACDVIIVGATHGISDGMLAEIKQAEWLGLEMREVYIIN